MKKTLKEFLEKHGARRDLYKFAEHLTLEEFLQKCERGDWILSLFKKMHPEKLRELTLAKGHCANTVRCLMKDERSLAAVDAAIAFGQGEISREEINAAADAAAAAIDAVDATWAIGAVRAARATRAAFAAYATCVADATSAQYHTTLAADTANSAAWAAAADAAAWADGAVGAVGVAIDTALTNNRKLTADVCRKYLPIEIWDEKV